MGLFASLSVLHKWNLPIIAFSSPTMISYLMLPFVYCLICEATEAKFWMCVCVYRGTQVCDLLHCYLGNVFLIVPKPCYTRRLAGHKWLASCSVAVGTTGRENYKMDGWENVRVQRGGVFHPLISEAAGVLLSGLDGQASDLNVWSAAHLLKQRPPSACFVDSYLLAAEHDRGPSPKITVD